MEPIVNANGTVVAYEMPKPDTSPVKVGDIFCYTWGYSMVLVDFYQVKRLAGKTQVVVQKIRSQETATGYLQGRTMPVRDAFIEPRSDRDSDKTELRKTLRYQKDGVPYLPFEFGWCARWDGTPQFWDHCD